MGKSVDKLVVYIVFKYSYASSAGMSLSTTHGSGPTTTTRANRVRQNRFSNLSVRIGVGRHLDSSLAPTRQQGRETAFDVVSIGLLTRHFLVLGSRPVPTLNQTLEKARNTKTAALYARMVKLIRQFATAEETTTTCGVRTREDKRVVRVRARETYRRHDRLGPRMA